MRWLWTYLICREMNKQHFGLGGWSSLVPASESLNWLATKCWEDYQSGTQLRTGNLTVPFFADRTLVQRLKMVADSTFTSEKKKRLRKSETWCWMFTHKWWFWFKASDRCVERDNHSLLADQWLSFQRQVKSTFQSVRWRIIETEEACWSVNRPESFLFTKVQSSN